jgi:hypothetical protein
MKRRRRYWLLFLALAIVICLVAIDQGTRMTWSRVQDRARAAGLAITAADMRTNAPLPAENAAPHYRRAIAALKLKPRADRTLLHIYATTDRGPEPAKEFARRGLGVVTWPRVEKALRATKPIFDDLDKAVALPHLDWNRRWELGHNLLLPEYADLRELAKNLALDARAAAARGDRASALNRLRQTRRMAEQIEQEPILIPFLVGVAIRTLADREALELVYRHRSDARMVAALRSYFEESRLPSMKRAMRGESFLVTTFLNSGQIDYAMLNGGHTPPPIFESVESFKLRLLSVSAVRDSVKSRLIDKYTKAVVAFPDNPEDWQTARRAMRDLDIHLSTDQSIAGSLGGILAPVFADAGSALGYLDAYRRMGVLLTLLADEWRLAGKWPAALPNAGEWSKDPFSGERFKYRLTSEGFVLHSIGADEKDGGGSLERSVRDLAIGPLKGRLEVRR